jgi:molybdenum cofactor cytidylyltransferase
LETRHISAILLAAGESKRMGQAKMLLPWGNSTVLGQVVTTFAAAGIEDLVVVTGGARREVEALVAKLGEDFPVRPVFNPDYRHGEMLSSIQAGVAALAPGQEAALVGLGDQPQVRESVVRRISAVFSQTGAPLVIPSFNRRRGHPWLAARPLWAEFLALPQTTTPRQFLETHATEITYLTVEDDSILRDVDTPEDYASQRPQPPC